MNEGEPGKLNSPLTEEMLQEFITKMVAKTVEGRRRNIKYEAGLGFVKNLHAGSGSDFQFLYTIAEGLVGAPAEAWEYIFEVAMKVYPDKGPQFYFDLFPKPEKIHLTYDWAIQQGWVKEERRGHDGC